MENKSITEIPYEENKSLLVMVISKSRSAVEIPVQ